MLFSELARGLAIGAIVGLLTFHRDHVLLIIGLATIEEIIEVFATLAERRFISMLVEPDLALPASTRVEARTHVIVLIGRPLGGLLFGIGPVFPFFADLASFTVSFLTLLGIRGKMATRTTPTPRMRLRIEINDGIKWLLNNDYVRVSIILNSWMTLISQALILVFIVEARSQHLPSLAIGVVLASSGLGGVLGATLGKVVDRLIGSHFRILEGCSRVKIQFCIWSAGLLVLAVSLASWKVPCMAIVMAVFGFIGAMGNMEFETYISKKVPQTMIGRLASIDRLTSFFMCAVGPAIGGLLAGYFGTQAAVWWLFALTVGPMIFLIGRSQTGIGKTGLRGIKVVLLATTASFGRKHRPAVNAFPPVSEFGHAVHADPPSSGGNTMDGSADRKETPVMIAPADRSPAPAERQAAFRSAAATGTP